MLPYELDGTYLLFSNYYVGEIIERNPGMFQDYDENSMVEAIRQYASNYKYIWFNAYEGQRPVGFIGGFMAECPWNKTLVFTNISYIYLLPSHRNKENFNQLMDEFIAWSKLAKAVRIMSTDNDIFQSSLEQLEFTSEKLMTKEL
jgi:GNAT superfamily N-acetyltransferase